MPISSARFQRFAVLVFAGDERGFGAHGGGIGFLGEAEGDAREQYQGGEREGAEGEMFHKFWFIGRLLGLRIHAKIAPGERLSNRAESHFPAPRSFLE